MAWEGCSIAAAVLGLAGTTAVERGAIRQRLRAAQITPWVAVGQARANLHDRRRGGALPLGGHRGGIVNRVQLAPGRRRAPQRSLSSELDK